MRLASPWRLIPPRVSRWRPKGGKGLKKIASSGSPLQREAIAKLRLRDPGLAPGPRRSRFPAGAEPKHLMGKSARRTLGCGSPCQLQPSADV